MNYILPLKNFEDILIYFLKISLNALLFGHIIVLPYLRVRSLLLSYQPPNSFWPKIKLKVTQKIRDDSPSQLLTFVCLIFIIAYSKCIP